MQSGVLSRSASRRLPSVVGWWLLMLLIVPTAGPLAAAGNTNGDDTVFVDRFVVGIQQVLIDDEHGWWRRGDEILARWPCDQAVELQVVATPGPDWVFQFDALPAGFDEIDSGRLAASADCEATDPVVIGVGASAPSLDDSVVLVLQRQVVPQPPTFEGIALAGNGVPDIINTVGVLSPDLAWIKDFPLTVELIGSADGYSASVGSVTGNDWTFSASSSGPYGVVAHRDGLEDTGAGTLDLRVAMITHLGATEVVDTGSERIVNLGLPCGEAYSGAFASNTQDLVPAVSTSYAAASTLPANSSLSPGGEFAYTPSCSPGSPENVLFLVDAQIQAQGNELSLAPVLVDIDVSGVEPGGPGPTVHGLIGAGETIDFFVQSDNGTLFIAPIEYMCGRLRELEIVGDADSYELLNAPEFMTLDDNIIAYHPDWDEPACNYNPNGLESALTLRAHKNGQMLDINKTAYAMNPRIDCVTHYPGVPAGGGAAPEPVVYCDTGGHGGIAELIELSYNIETPHEVHVHVRPSLDIYTPHQAYEYEGNNVPSFMSFNVNTGVKTASPSAGGAGFYFTTVKAANGGKQTIYFSIDYQVVE